MLFKRFPRTLDIMASPNPTQATKVVDAFELYDLKVEVICPPNGRILCGAKDGDHFILEGEMLKLPPGQGISIYSLSAYAICFAWGLDPVARTPNHRYSRLAGAVLPLLAAKQRVTHPNDWMTTDAEVA